jgi:hypothetical protein
MHLLNILSSPTGAQCKENCSGVLHDTLHRLYQGVLDFQKSQFVGTHVNVF